MRQKKIPLLSTVEKTLILLRVYERRINFYLFPNRIGVHTIAGVKIVFKECGFFRLSAVLAFLPIQPNAGNEYCLKCGNVQIKRNY